MPIYEFACSCGNKFEKLCKIGENSSVPCSQCGGEAVKVLSAFRMGRSSSEPPGSHAAAASGCSSCASSGCATCG